MTATLTQKRIRTSREEFLQLLEESPARPFETKRFSGLKLELGATFSGEQSLAQRGE